MKNQKTDASLFTDIGADCIYLTLKINTEMDKYEIVETIGTGSFGVVNKAIDKATKNIVALKGINKVFGMRRKMV